MANAGPFVQLLVKHWDGLERHVSGQAQVVVDGRDLTLADVIASSRYGRQASISREVLENVAKGTEQVYGKIGEGEVIYGINTGFGGSANVRMKALEEIQRGLIRGLHYGILSGSTGINNTTAVKPHFASAKPISNPVEGTTMPESWVRASMLVRLNSLSRGASGIRPILLERLIQLLNLDIVPRVPLRGSISASGDLSPLSYLGGVMRGTPSVQAWIDDDKGGRKLVNADEALVLSDIKPIDIRAKEGLAIVNGTATSTAVGSLAIHEVMCLAAMSQVLTAMSVEALCGTDESFHPFFSEVRPHPGQAESAASINAFLSGSQLVEENTGSGEFTMRQERYATRTAPQWIGPILEDLVLAYSQISTEINSVTDNPLIHPSGKMLHGGNFQAKAVTSAMEKARQGCQSLGQMLFAQCTEIINPATNKGLIPNLVVDEPSESQMWKGTDIFIAALQSELGFLANPVTHVQSAEMGNQAINSLALISARCTLTAVDVLTQLAAAHLVALCQALDLRALHASFREALKPRFIALTKRCIETCKQSGASSNTDAAQQVDALWSKFLDITAQTTHMDSKVRFRNATNNLQTTLLQNVPCTQESLSSAQIWCTECADEASEVYTAVKSEYLASPDASPILGVAAKKMYKFVRTTLGVPFFDEVYIKAAEWAYGKESDTSDPKYKFRTMGSMISAVYDAMRNGSLYSVAIDCFKEFGDQQ